MKQPSERGVIGAWAYQARGEAGLSVEQVAERVAAKGQAVSPATIRGIESGSKKPSAHLLRMLAAVLESVPPGASQPTAEPSLAAVLRDLVTELAEMRKERLQLVARVERLEAAMQGSPSVAEDAAEARAEAERTDMPSPRQRSSRPASGR